MPRAALTIACVAAFSAFSASHAEESTESAQAPDVGAARLAAESLLGTVCGDFDCEYSDLIVVPLEWKNETRHLVKFTCDGKRCDEAMRVLTERGVRDRLAFSMRKPPAEVEPDPFESEVPYSYDLIHEIDPEMSH